MGCLGDDFTIARECGNLSLSHDCEIFIDKQVVNRRRAERRRPAIDGKSPRSQEAHVPGRQSASHTSGAPYVASVCRVPRAGCRL